MGDNSTFNSFKIALNFQDLKDVIINDKDYIVDVRHCPEIVNIPEGIKGISSACFSGENLLKVVILPSTIEDIDDYIFANCINLEEIIIPKKLEVFVNKLKYGNNAKVIIK